jgi:hypothetical protein
MTSNSYVDPVAVDLCIEAASLIPQGWRPIETAPKDGTEIDIWAIPDGGGEPRRYIDVSWRTEETTAAGAISFWQQYSRIRGKHCWVHARPTHWMPSPAAPVADVEDPDA